MGHNQVDWASGVRFPYDSEKHLASCEGCDTNAYDMDRFVPVILQHNQQDFSGRTTHKYVRGLVLAYIVDRAGAAAKNGRAIAVDQLDSTGAVIQTYQSDDNGGPIQNQGASTERLPYAGQERDKDCLINLRIRAYSPSLVAL